MAIAADGVLGNSEVGAATGLIGLLSVAGSIFAPWVFGVLLDTYGMAPGQAGYTAGHLRGRALLWRLSLADAVAGRGQRQPRASRRDRGRLMPVISLVTTFDDVIPHL